MCDNWFENIDNRKLIWVVLLHIRKALHHSILLEKAELYGVSDRELMWFKSYLTTRQQRFVTGHSSSQRKLLRGVPQGSILALCYF